MGDWLIGLLGGPDNARAIAGVAQALAAVCTAVMALAAVIIAIWNGYITRKHARFSIVPVLSAWADYPDADRPGCKVYLTNKGFGPAIVKSFQVFHDGNPVEGTMFDKVSSVIKDSFGSDLEEVYHVSSLDRGHAFAANEQVVIASFRVSEELARSGTDKMVQIMAPLSLVVRYRDIYRRNWVFAVHRFDGYTFRESRWFPSHWKARWALGKIVVRGV